MSDLIIKIDQKHYQELRVFLRKELSREETVDSYDMDAFNRLESVLKSLESGVCVIEGYDENVTPKVMCDRLSNTINQLSPSDRVKMIYDLKHSILQTLMQDVDNENNRLQEIVKAIQLLDPKAKIELEPAKPKKGGKS